MESSISSDRSDDGIFLSAAVGVTVFMALFLLECKVYDLATGAFFAFGLGLMARGKLSEFFALFAFAAVNRETVFLLIGVFAVYFLVRYGMSCFKWVGLSVLYQAFIFLVVRVCLMIIFEGNAGVEMLVRPWANLGDFMAYPLRSLVHWGGFAVVIWMCMRRWNVQPLMLRCGFAVLMPALMLMYLVLGWAFEVRVFAEVFPVVWVMGAVYTPKNSW